MSIEQESVPQVIDLPETRTAVVDGVVAGAELPSFFDQAFQRLGGTLAQQGVVIIGPAFALYHAPVGETVDLEVGFPIGDHLTEVDGVRPGTLPGGRAAHLVHLGSYDGLGESWGKLTSWMTEQGHTPATLWEVYVTEPSPDIDPTTLRTDLFASLA